MAQFDEDEFDKLDWDKLKDLPPELIGDSEQTPLWMNNLPSCLDENDELAAIQALVYEGDTPEEVAETLKEAGNEAFLRKPGDEGDLRQAIHLYSEALKQNSPNEKKNSIYHSNRSAVWIKLERFRAAKEDGDIAIKLNPQNVKAFYRVCMACSKMERWKQALDYANRGLKVDEENKTLLAQKKKIEQKIKEEEKKRKEREEREEKRAEKEYIVNQALKLRRLQRGKNPLPSEIARQYNTEIKVEGTELFVPFLFVYEESNQTDFIQSVSEHNTLEDHLSMMLPQNEKGEGEGEFAYWDSSHNYTLDNLVLYFYEDLNTSGNYVIVKRETPILTLLQHPKYKLAGDIAIVYIASTKSPFFSKKFGGK